ncbi:hypothetical protein DFR28_101753 [Arenicella xantha]|uniref:Uncharacterized protein n=1 Tax=Arenicella xantha TaxID=644221 RepID=A0A395JPD9_9GAMM|nr:hypothetical protein DFR28_101753 [Arenicella xantha]
MIALDMTTSSNSQAPHNSDSSNNTKKEFNHIAKLVFSSAEFKCNVRNTAD